MLKGFDKDKLLKAMEEKAVKALRERVERLRCSEHGQSPKLKRTGKNAQGPTFEVSACCESMMEKAKKALAGK